MTDRRKWLYQGVRPRWVRLRTWERIFADGYRSALADVAAGYVNPEQDPKESIKSGPGVLAGDCEHRFTPATPDDLDAPWLCTECGGEER